MDNPLWKAVCRVLLYRRREGEAIPAISETDAVVVSEVEEAHVSVAVTVDVVPVVDTPASVVIVPSLPNMKPAVSPEKETVCAGHVDAPDIETAPMPMARSGQQR